jgi:hypothetical protein
MNMKKLFVLCVGVSMLFLFTACGSKESQEQVSSNDSEDVATITKDGSAGLIKEVVLKEGKVLSIMTGGTELLLEKEIMFADGTKVFPDGKIILSDGTSSSLQEGDKIIISSSVVKATPKTETNTTKETTLSTKDTNTTKKTTSTTLTKAIYRTYASGDFALAKNGGKIILFFSDKSCSICSEINTNISSNIGTAPKNVAILKVEYDNYQDLRKRYGVLHHHTFVQVDETGSLITMWVNANSLNDIIAKIR